MKIQVGVTHYNFDHYYDKKRWSSIWHQLNEISQINPKLTLEIGPGTGLLKLISQHFDLKIETIDIDSKLNPDFVGSATCLPFEDNSYDLVCAFQILEHLPYAKSLESFKEMCRVSKDHLLISLPDSKVSWRYLAHIPKYGSIEFFLERPFFKAKKHEFDGEHHWEINKKDFPLSKIVNDFSLYAKLVKTYRVAENPYHRFFLFRKIE